MFGVERFLKALTREETIEYCKRAQAGDEVAKEKLKIHNLRLVVQRIKTRFSNTNMESDELVVIGIIGLLKAVETFDVNKNIAFSTYASRCIDNEILMSFRKLKKSNRNVSLESYIAQSNEANDGLTYGDILTDGNDFVEDLLNKEIYRDLYEALNHLSERDQIIIKLYYGFGCQPMTQKEIAQLINYKQSYVSILLANAENEIRKYIERLENNNIYRSSSKVLCKKKK